MRCRARGFTLLELMITVAIIGILAAVALPAYNEYIRRSQIQEAFGFLSDYRTKMEQYYQDNRNYGSPTDCASDGKGGSLTLNPNPAPKYFEYNCTTDKLKQQTYTVYATGVGGMARGHEYTIDQAGIRGTTWFKGSQLPSTAPCWLAKSASCSE